MNGLNFLTAFDDRIAVEGSVDPLGATAIWTTHARRFISNLTTVTSSTHDFLTVLAGCAFGSEEGYAKGVTRVPAFLRFEQLGAFARQANHIGQTVRGVRVVSQLISTKLRVSHKKGILSNQRAYGLWGYYTGPTSVSGCISFANEGYVLSPKARQIIVDYIGKHLSLTERDRIISIVRSNDEIPDAKIRPLLPVLKSFYSDIKRNSGLHQLLTESIAMGQESMADIVVRRKQELLYSLVDAEDPHLSGVDLLALSKRSAAKGDIGGQLANDLELAASLDHCLTRATALFSFIRHKKASLSDFARDLKDNEWLPAESEIHVANALEAIRGVLGDKAGYQLWHSYLTEANDHQSMIARLCDIHAAVLMQRKGAPWVERSGDNVLTPIRKSSTSNVLLLPDLQQELSYGFFIPSMISLKGEL